MSETQADIGYNSTFGMAEAQAGPFPALAEVTSITPPGLSRDAINATHLKSPEQFEEFIAGIKKAGEAKMVLNFTPAVYQTLVAAFDAGKQWCQIGWPDGSTTLTFLAVITGLDAGELNNDKMTATLTVKPSGKPLLAVA